jgi:hypothetical protein
VTIVTANHLLVRRRMRLSERGLLAFVAFSAGKGD